MYIRRKVYSVLTDDYGYERLFSTNDVLLDGYDERYFSDDYASGRDTGALVGGALGLGAAGAGAHYAHKNLDKWARKDAEKIAKQIYGADESYYKKLQELGEKYENAGKVSRRLNDKLGHGATNWGGMQKENGLWRNMTEAEKQAMGAERVLAQEKALKKMLVDELGEKAAAKYTTEDILKMLNSKQTLGELKSAEEDAIKKVWQESKGKIGKSAKTEILNAFKGTNAGRNKAIAAAGALAALGYGGAKLGGVIGGASNKRR